jgi:5-(carboxyamino)imidazole ribonucleotide synthase
VPHPVTGLPVIGIVGGGQLARMTYQAAIPLGVGVAVLATDPTESAALVAADVSIGHHTDWAALSAFAARVDVLTFDHEHVPGELLERLVAAGRRVHPGPQALRYAQDKLAMRRRLTELGLPAPRWTALPADGALEALVAFGDEVGWPVVAKAVRGGYDGRGVWILDDAAAAAELVTTGTELYAEERVDLAAEVAALIARSPSGQAVAWPVVETVQRDGICVEVLAPAPELSEDLAGEATRIALTVAAELDVTGVLAVELFVTRDGRLLVNELAMRPHNSGHWTIDGAVTSQFEQHVRAVLDWPLGSPAATAPAVAMANLLGGEDPDLASRVPLALVHHPAAKIHLYGKTVRPGRKIGHVTVAGEDPGQVRVRAVNAVAELSGEDA